MRWGRRLRQVLRPEWPTGVFVLGASGWLIGVALSGFFEGPVATRDPVLAEMSTTFEVAALSWVAAGGMIAGGVVLDRTLWRLLGMIVLLLAAVTSVVWFDAMFLVPSAVVAVALAAHEVARAESLRGDPGSHTR